MEKLHLGIPSKTAYETKPGHLYSATLSQEVARTGCCDRG